MGRVFGILVIVVLIWAGIEIYTKGTHDAFGGAFRVLSNEPTPQERAARSPAQRAGDSVDRSFRQMEKRYDHLVEE